MHDLGRHRRALDGHRRRAAFARHRRLGGRSRSHHRHDAGLFAASPAVSVVEQIAAAWLLDLFGLPPGCGVWVVSRRQLANFTCLAAARHAVLRRVGWNVEELGLHGAPRVHVVLSEEAHSTVVMALRLLGLGAATAVRVPADAQGRLLADALAAALAACDGPAMVCAQVGNVNSGACDPMPQVITVARAHGAWVHVDAAFGLWARTAERREGHGQWQAPEGRPRQPHSSGRGEPEGDPVEAHAQVPIVLRHRDEFEPERCDLIVLTHGHGDHVGDTVSIAQRFVCPVVAQVELRRWLTTQGVADDGMTCSSNKGGTVAVADLKVTLTDANHSSSTPDGTYTGEACGAVLELEDGFRIYFAGDTNVFGDMSLIGRIYKPDVA